ncbi:MAG: hypothetical protein JWR25_1878 [Noviherbaspirillum sp.]|nr:hypothetical protein [Noviherbaspirillum sp.]
MRTARNKLFTATVLSGIVLINGGLAGCSKTESSEALISEAKSFRQKGDTKSAIIQLKNALQQNPDDAQARYLLGTLYIETGEFQSGEKELRKALSLGANPSEVATSLGTALVMLGEFQRALDETQNAASEKSDAALHSLRGNAYLALGKLADAKASFNEALKAKADHPDALIGLARLAFQSNDIESATRYAEQAVTTSPDYALVWFVKGDLLKAQGKIDAALAAYDEVLKRKPGDVQAHVAKAGLEIHTGKFSAAKADIEAAKKSAPNALIIQYTQALLEYSQGKHAAALEAVQQVLRSAPDHMPSILLAGATQYSLGATQQAEQHLKKFLEKNPGHLYASKLLASCLLKNGDTQRAIGVLTSVNKHASQDMQLLALTGEAYMHAKDHRKASEYFEKASALDPKAPMFRTALAMNRLAQGDNERAIADLERSIDLDPKQSSAGIMLVMTHMRLKEYDKALAAINKLEKAQPDNPVIHNLKGGIYAANKNMAAARASFEKALVHKPTFYPAVANLAQLDLVEKKPNEATKRLESFLKIDKKSTEAMIALAEIAASQGRHKDAITWLERANNEKPDELKPALLLASHYLHAAETKKSLALAQKLQLNHPNNPEVIDVLARAQFANEDLTGALQSYNKLTAVLPNSPVAQFRLASIHTRMKNETAAMGALRKAVQLKPDYLEAQVALATLEVRQGNPEQALAIARQIQKQSAKSSVGYEMEGDILMTQKKIPLAVKAYEQAMNRTKGGPLMVKLHNALKASGNEKEGDVRLAQWQKDNPRDTITRMYVGTTNLMNRQTKGAIEQFQMVVQQEPKNVAALNNLAIAYKQEKDPRALEYAEKAYQLEENNPAVLDTLGSILIEQDKIARALPLLKKAVTLAPAAPDSRYHLALALSKSGDNASARKELAQALESGKPFEKIEEAKALQKQLQ